MSNAEIGNRIKELREECKLTREELADRARISTKFLYEIENGKKAFSATTLLKIAKALSCSCDFILTGKNKEDYDIINGVLGKFSKNQLKCISEILKLIYDISK